MIRKKVMSWTFKDLVIGERGTSIDWFDIKTSTIIPRVDLFRGKDRFIQVLFVNCTFFTG